MQETQGPVYAGFWIRTLAAAIDTLLSLLLLSPLMLMFGGSYSIRNIDGLLTVSADSTWSQLLSALLIIACWVLWQATPGKMLLSMKIVDAKTGLAPGKGQLIGRYLAYFVALIPMGLGFFWIAVDRRKQGWHDKLAGTVVVRD